MKKRALISVSNKDQIESFAKRLVALDYEILSTGGTLKKLKETGVPVVAVEDVTEFPEMLDGRVKTIHPRIHAGLLAKRSEQNHMDALAEQNIQPIELVVVNLYPFKETLAKENVSHGEIIENIDIGGPTMLRAAAKNYEDVIVVVDPSDYEYVLQKLETNDVDLQTRQQLAAKVFRHTAQYDALIAEYFSEQTDDLFPDQFTVTYEKVQDLRYGENPHQQAAFYKDVRTHSGSLSSAKQHHGKALSYNNIQDANAALEMVKRYEAPAIVAVKHMNPCGIGVANTIEVAFDKAYAADPISIFGGIVASNRTIDRATAEKLREIFLEIIIAPSFTEEAFDILTGKKNIRLLTVDMETEGIRERQLTSVSGGLLVQTMDDGVLTEDGLEVVTNRKPTEEEFADLQFAWEAVKHVKSNAIVLAKDGQTIGIGAGQMNRVGAAKIAIEQAGDRCQGAVMASDAFFPMPDTVEAAVEAGITAIIQPGGSKRDQDSIDVCNEHNIAMVFTKMRHFKH